ncbi:MAG: hypothetical protein ABI599_09190 [Flavobacteriales bacterium]
MRTPVLRMQIASGLLATSVTLLGARGVLNADGLLRVRGADLSSATITVVPRGAAAYSLPVGTKDFTLSLPLDDTYLISFERPGCPTKQVYFDTTVPAGEHAEEFHFPFIVTLQHMEEERMFVYEGPVGFVRYQNTVVDFGYETRYLVKVDEELHERMQQLQATGVDPKVLVHMSSAMVVDRSRDGLSATSVPASLGEGIEAPNVSEVPAMVNATSVMKVVAEEPAIIASPVDEAPARFVVPPTEALVEPSVQPVVLPLPVPIVNKGLVVISMPASVVNKERVVAPAASMPMARERNEETIVEQHRVTHIVRFTRPNGSVEEFREVKHAYGAVFYFRNMGSITQRAFNAFIT